MSNDLPRPDVRKALVDGGQKTDPLLNVLPGPMEKRDNRKRRAQRAEGIAFRQWMIPAKPKPLDNPMTSRLRHGIRKTSVSPEDEMGTRTWRVVKWAEN
jgi:hypothetical protein